MTTFGDQVFQLGGVPLVTPGSIMGPDAKYFFVDPVHGSSGANGLSLSNASSDLEDILDQCTTGKNDTIFYIGGTTAMNLAAAVEWSKSYTHLIGLCAPTMVAQRARIFQSTLDTSPLLKISGSGCIFKDFYIFQGVNDADSLINVEITGSRNYFQNVHFAGGGHATQAIDGGASLLINGGEENMFVNCTIGLDTVEAGDGMAGLVFAATGGAARNIFRDCHFTMHAGHAGAIFIELLGNAGIDRYQIFERCMFTNLSDHTMDQAIKVAAGFDSNHKRIILKDCSLLGATDWQTGNLGVVSINGGTYTAGGNTGIMAPAHST